MRMTLTGENSFLWSEELHKLIVDYIAKNGEHSILKVDGEEAQFEEIRKSVVSIPFLAPKQLVIIRTPSKNKQFLDNYEQIFEAIPESTDIVIVEPKLDKRLSYYKYLKKYTEYKEYPELQSYELSSWIQEYAKGHEAEISQKDSIYLIDKVGINQQKLAQEIQKLSLFDKKITAQHIEVLTEITPQSTIFQLIESAFAGKDKEVLKLYAQQKSLRVEPQKFIALLTWQLHVLALLKSGEDRTSDQIASESRLNPYVIRKSVDIAKKISLSELKERIRDLTSIDKKLKSTSINSDEALQHYLLSLSN